MGMKEEETKFNKLPYEQSDRTEETETKKKMNH